MKGFTHIRNRADELLDAALIQWQEKELMPVRVELRECLVKVPGVFDNLVLLVCCGCVTQRHAGWIGESMLDVLLLNIDVSESL